MGVRWRLKGFSVIELEENLVEDLDNIKAIKTNYIERKLVDAKRIGLIGWLRGYRKRKD